MVVVFFSLVLDLCPDDICLFVNYRLKCVRGCLLLSTEKQYVALLTTFHSLAKLFCCGVIFSTNHFWCRFSAEKPRKRFVKGVSIWWCLDKDVVDYSCWLLMCISDCCKGAACGWGRLEVIFWPTDFRHCPSMVWHSTILLFFFVFSSILSLFIKLFVTFYVLPFVQLSRSGFVQLCVLKRNFSGDLICDWLWW